MTSTAKPVLVATDLSARSDRAVDRAAFLAHSWGVRLKVVHVVEAGSNLDGNRELAAEAVRSVLPDTAANVDILLPQGSAPATIVRTAEETDCRLIVTGVARFNHIGDFLIGTAVDHVVRNAKVPVLVVKQRARGPYKTILVATDFSSCSRSALLAASQMFPEAAIHLLHAFHVPYEGLQRSAHMRLDVTDEADRELKKFVADPAIPDQIRPRISLHIAYGDTTTVVTEAAAKLGADLVVIGAHGCSGFARAVIGGRAESLLLWVQPDTLMVREWP